MVPVDFLGSDRNAVLSLVGVLDAFNLSFRKVFQRSSGNRQTPDHSLITLGQLATFAQRFMLAVCFQGNS